MKLLIEKDVEIPMRDGVILRADLYRPDDEKKHPALVFRSPYEKETLDRRWGQLSPVGFAKAGYKLWRKTHTLACGMKAAFPMQNYISTT